MEIGTIVWLKSGGPPMTVSSRVEMGHVECSWFEGGKFNARRINVNALTDVDPSADVPKEGTNPTPTV